MTDITPIPSDYAAVLKRIKDDVRSSRSHAAVALNRELVGLYWRLGEVIVEQQKQSQWGRGVVERLAADLKDAFPTCAGFRLSTCGLCGSFIWRGRKRAATIRGYWSGDVAGVALVAGASGRLGQR